MICFFLKWLAAMLAVTVGVDAQTPAAFEVASIRRNLSGGLNTRIEISGSRVTMVNASVKTVIRNAYGILSFQLAGAPSARTGLSTNSAASTSVRIGRRGRPTSTC